MMMLDSDPFYDGEELLDEEGEDVDDLSEMGMIVGGGGAQGSGNGGVGNATLVAGEKRKHRDRAV